MFFFSAAFITSWSWKSYFILRYFIFRSFNRGLY